MPFTCGAHRIFIYERGGLVPVTELTPVESVRWERVRDDISTANATIPTHTCCEELGDLRTILHEMHIERNGIKVWEGPIVRLEYEHDVVRIYAEDVLWQAKRMVLETGYSMAYPNIGTVVQRMDWLLRENCYSRFGDPWKVVPNLRPLIFLATDPRSARSVNACQFTVWEDFDKYAEDSGADYTVVNRLIYYFDTHLAWNIIPDLDPSFMSQFPRVVEYGNSAASRFFITDGEGHFGWAQNPDLGYGIIDKLITSIDEGNPNGDPTTQEIAAWTSTAVHELNGLIPPPLSVVIPENTTLLPGAPWDIEDLIPGSWFQVTIDNLCRTTTAWQRLHQVTVTEAAPAGETVQFTAVSPPSEMLIP